MKILISCDKIYFYRLEKVISMLLNLGFEITVPNGYKDYLNQQNKPGASHPDAWKNQIRTHTTEEIRKADAILIVDYTSGKERDIDYQEAYVSCDSFIEMYEFHKCRKNERTKIYMTNLPVQSVISGKIMQLFKPEIIGDDFEKIKKEAKKK